MEREREFSTPYQDDEIDLYELWLTLKKRKKTVILTTLLFLTVSLAYAFLSKPVYKTEATLVPLGGKSGGVSSLLSAFMPTQEGLNVKAVLESRTLRERVINELNLMPILFPDRWNKPKAKKPTLFDGAAVLKGFISASENKNTGIITFSVTFPEKPEVAYQIAQTSLKVASQILNEKSAKLAHNYTQYVKSQLDKAKEKYKLLERVYQDFLKGKIKEVPFIFDEKDVKLIKRFKGNTNLPSTFVNLPQYRFNMEKLKLQMEIASQLLATLTQQYALAKAQEQKEKVSFQVIDPPYIPDKPYKPKKRFIATVGLVSGLFMGIFLAFFREWLENAKKRGERNGKEFEV